MRCMAAHINIKKKYANGGPTWSPLEIHEQVIRAGYPSELIDKIEKLSYSEREFFKKNDALTNVERHKWRPSMVFMEEFIFSGKTCMR